MHKHQRPKGTGVSDIYYRVIAETGAVATMQDFDERDYDPKVWLRGGDGEPLRFDDEADASRAYSQRLHAISDALQMIGEAFGDLTIPRDSRFIAHKLVAYFHLNPANG